MKAKAFSGILLILSLLLIRCVPSSYTAPQVLKPGEMSVGVGYGLSNENAGDFSL